MPPACRSPACSMTSSPTTARWASTWDGDVPTVAVWAPTAKSVKLHLFDTSTSDPATPDHRHDRGRSRHVERHRRRAVERQVLPLRGRRSTCRSTGQVENNIVTDPYSLSLSMNSTRSQIVNLDDPALMPEAGTAAAKAAAGRAGGHRALRTARARLQRQRRDGARRSSGHLQGLHLPDSNGMQPPAALAEAGLTHVHLLPVFDIATINEDKAQRGSSPTSR